VRAHRQVGARRGAKKKQKNKKIFGFLFVKKFEALHIPGRCVYHGKLFEHDTAVATDT
jgi:hypothetical protein